MTSARNGVDADAAFGLLRWRSQHNNVKLRRLAEQIVCDYLALAQAQAQARPARAAYDYVLLTAHRRVCADPDADGLAH